MFYIGILTLYRNFNKLYKAKYINVCKSITFNYIFVTNWYLMYYNTNFKIKKKVSGIIYKSSKKLTVYLIKITGYSVFPINLKIIFLNPRNVSKCSASLTLGINFRWNNDPRKFLFCLLYWTYSSVMIWLWGSCTNMYIF